ncbi:MmgE/PrpD family protein [Sulfitobacter geojensis]|uniref:MmgE/PrpD family protein n=1 Tax=Sulfitobacter geojensis TaxID=1342299 RepID=UPI00046A90CD|nr:MmgE/PrpD family protein [Sulfitobacter geojensis]KHA54064.1 MmgE/PrpD family protein [Sulfitobacter geojensis]NYI29882.1 2-methylcitrate dehydratase PrpD [Sulfitobacter geojensis]
MAFIDNLIQLSQTPADRLPVSALQKARLSLLDWMVCGIAGKDEPVAEKMRDFARNEAGNEVASIFGGGMAPARMAALANGTISHALDFDDTHFRHVGHLSVGIFPAAFVVAEEVDASVRTMVKAFLIGAEAAIRVGIALGVGHYNRGFHQTATAGAFGATIAAGRLYELNGDELRHALGLCATRASGLRSQFGTMGKPYNAGIAASNGVECAQLAALGITSTHDGLEAHQGFLTTHADEIFVNEAWIPSPQEAFLFDENKYKLHACCHGIHAMIETLRAKRQKLGGLNEIEKITLYTNPRWLNVCDKKAPRNGLEVKFSYAWLAGMTLRGDKTGDNRAYTDTLAEDAELSAFAEKVEVLGDPGVTDLQARVEIALSDGQTINARYDLDAPQSNVFLKDRLTVKAVSTIGEKGKLIFDQFERLDIVSVRELAALIRSD